MAPTPPVLPGQGAEIEARGGHVLPFTEHGAGGGQSTQRQFRTYLSLSFYFSHLAWEPVVIVDGPRSSLGSQTPAV